MKNNYSKIFIAFSLAMSLGFLSFANAETTTNTSKKEDTKVEISLPIEKDDFILFYGVTKDDNLNVKLADLRADFISKFKLLKEDYEKSFYSTIGENEIVIQDSIDNVKSVKDIATKIDTKTLKSAVSTSVKKYDIAKDNIISPVVNIVNDKAAIQTGSSSWFKKIKSLFGW